MLPSVAPEVATAPANVDPDVSIVIPVYNESENVADLVPG